MKECMWCNDHSAKDITKTGYWELHDGTRALQIKEIPALYCESCNMEYHEDEIVEEIEDQLLLIDTKKLSQVLTFKELMAQERFLKKNYFKSY
ncbi:MULTISPECIES: YokU family protein [unclassified Fictibacillus]|uniref:YokU family protein n=1 Tax=unclassified Fictibacillus TaxID=2644029 RepID=UPI0006A77952|nr:MULTISPECIES: YokU family protein [unclassified Fictibacillus]UZJ77013.1 YokU family protein [Fictibacillus sp. KU28468]